MGYVAVKGGTEAIEASIRRLNYERLKTGLALDVRYARAGLRSLIDQVMSEGSLFDEGVAALCVKQAEGSPEEAVFLLRAFRSTLPRLHVSLPVSGEAMRLERRISAAFKDVPGGQLLGASSDYLHRLLDGDLIGETDADARAWHESWREEMSRPAGADRATWVAGGPGTEAANAASGPEPLPIGRLPKVVDHLRHLGLMSPAATDDTPPKDVTKSALTFPTTRSERLQVLTRGQTGTVTALGYASLRGYGPLLHPTVAELRVGRLPVAIPDPLSEATTEQRLEDAYYVGEVHVTEVESVIPVTASGDGSNDHLEFELGYGACFGQNETKAIAMSLLDQCLERPDPRQPTHDEEFVLLHVDSVESTGFISHLKLPHYVTFQSELDNVRHSRTGGEEATRTTSPEDAA